MCDKSQKNNGKTNLHYFSFNEIIAYRFRCEYVARWHRISIKNGINRSDYTWRTERMFVAQTNINLSEYKSTNARQF